MHRAPRSVSGCRQPKPRALHRTIAARPGPADHSVASKVARLHAARAWCWVAACSSQWRASAASGSSGKPGQVHRAQQVLGLGIASAAPAAAVMPARLSKSLTRMAALAGSSASTAAVSAASCSWRQSAERHASQDRAAARPRHTWSPPGCRSCAGSRRAARRPRSRSRRRWAAAAPAAADRWRPTPRLIERTCEFSSVRSLPPLLRGSHAFAIARLGAVERGAAIGQHDLRRALVSAMPAAASSALSPPPTTSTRCPAYCSGSSSRYTTFGSSSPGTPSLRGVPRRPMASSTLRARYSPLRGDYHESRPRVASIFSTRSW